MTDTTDDEPTAPPLIVELLNTTATVAEAAVPAGPRRAAEPEPERGVSA